MRILILGVKGYIGYALYQFLKERGYEVFGLDNDLRQINVATVGSNSLFPIDIRKEEFWDLDISKEPMKLEGLIYSLRPEAIIHLAEQPSAPFSMKSRENSVETQRNNVLGTLNLLWILKNYPGIHLIKLGTMGVYGTPDKLIPENGEPYPYDPASFYHNSKAFDSINIRKCCQWWGLNATDIHQGPVYGHLHDTRFDYDQYFGTVINRFIAESLIEKPLTVYGSGNQIRGFINLQNTLESLELAIKNPPKGYRVFNQITELFSINTLAKMVSDITGAKIEHLENPRYEKEKHKYEVVHENLLKLGLKPIYLKDVLPEMIKKLEPYKNRINPEVINPTTKW